MARTAYWVIDLASYTAPTNAEIRQGQRTGGATALVSGSEAFAATSGSGTITEATTVTTLSAGTQYRLSWTIYDDVGANYPASAPQHYVWTYITNTGALSAQSATVAGTALRFRAFTSTGALSAQSATVAGAANHPHTTSGALSAGAATVAGSSVHPHTTSGALSAQAATVSGSASLTLGGTFGSTGALSADVATVSGTAAHLTLHASTGALSAQEASVSGTAVHYTLHASTGALSAQEASVAGDAAHSWVVTHDTSGTLSAGSATVSGLAQRNGVFADEVTRGVPGRPRFQRWAVTINGKRFFGSQEEIERLVREFAEEQAEKPKPKRAKIVVKPGIAKPEVEKAPEVVEQAQEIQQDMREVYAQAYRVAIQRLAEETIRREIEDEEDLLGIL